MNPVVETLDDSIAIIIYLAFIAAGFATCFHGAKIFRLALALLLTLAGTLGGIQLASVFDLGLQSGVLVGGACGAVVGLLVSFVFARAAAAVAGMMLAYILVMPQLGGDIQAWTNLLVLIASCLSGALLGVFLAGPTILIATSFTGAFFAVYGGLYFVDGTTLLSISENAIETGQVLAGKRWASIAALGLGAAGAFVQARHIWRGGRSIKDPL